MIVNWVYRKHDKTRAVIKLDLRRYERRKKKK